MVVFKYFIYLLTLVSVESALQDGEDEVVASVPVDSPEDAPYLVSLTNNGIHYCSGVCIDELWLVTAAHCIKPQWAKTTTLHFGTVFANTSKMVRKIQESFVHPIVPIKPQFTTSKANNETLNNIALIKFDTKLLMSATITKIEIEKKSGPFEQHTAKCIGYGKMCINDTESTEARSVAFKIHRHDNYVIFRECDITGNIICKCDSGGPFTLDNKLVAITVCGYNCGDQSKKLSNIMLRVTPYINWIKSKLESRGNRYVAAFSLIAIVLYLITVL